VYLRTIYRQGVESYLYSMMDRIYKHVMKANAGATIMVERVDYVISTIAAVIFRERAMKAIAVTLALLVIAIALPSIY